jgi:4-amino-4-deoxy-L-arabinose transferase-like glycosyltransferase
VPPRLTPRLAAVVLVVLVAVSAALRLLAARAIPGPFIAPDEMIYTLLGRSFWADGRLSLLGADTPFYSLLYPAFAGLPLSLGLRHGFPLLQAVQAVVVSLTAVVVYLWGRDLVGRGWALVAGALSLTPPALLYAGLAMTESLFLPVMALAAWALAAALERPTAARQLLLAAALLAAAATRLQALVLAPVVVTAVLLDAGLARDRRRLRPWAPAAVVALAVVVPVLAWRAATGSWKDVLGAYATVAGDYHVGEAAKYVVWHAGDLLLLTIAVPVLALGALAVEAIAGRLSDARERALLVTALSLAAWLVVEVGVFASRYVGQLAERDLIGALPPLFLVLALWLRRGAPRPQPWTAILAVAIAVPGVLLPLDRLVTDRAVPDAFMVVPLLHAGSGRELLWLAVLIGSVAAFLLLPRRWTPLLAGAVGVLLVAASVSAARELGDIAQDARNRFFADGDRSWIDHSSDGAATILYDGNAYWPSVWQQLVWNDDLRAVVTLPDLPVPGPLPQRVVSPRFDGYLFDLRGQPLENRLLVVPSVFTVRGEKLADLEQRDLDRAGLALWRTQGPPRLATWTRDVLPNGDFSTARVTVYGCAPGHLEAILLRKSGDPVEIRVDGRSAGRVRFRPDGVWDGEIPAPPDADGRTSCEFELLSAGLVGSTRLEYVPD